MPDRRICGTPPGAYLRWYSKCISFSKIMPRTRLVNPWWLEPGTEICPTCHQVYLYETEYRCTDCDGPRCQNCVQVREALTIVCLDCFDCSEEEAEVS
jgi:hypothetical protein